MPIVHDPATGRFSSAGGASKARRAPAFKKGALVKENRLGAKPLEVFEKRGNMLFVAPKYGPDSYGTGEWVHKTKVVKA